MLLCHRVYVYVYMVCVYVYGYMMPGCCHVCLPYIDTVVLVYVYVDCVLPHMAPLLCLCAGGVYVVVVLVVVSG